MEQIFIPLATVIVTGIISWLIAHKQMHRDKLATKQNISKAIDKASQSINSEVSMFAMLRPGESLSIPMEKRASNQDGSLKARIHEHLEKAFENI